MRRYVQPSLVTVGVICPNGLCPTSQFQAYMPIVASTRGNPRTALASCTCASVIVQPFFSRSMWRSRASAAYKATRVECGRAELTIRSTSLPSLGAWFLSFYHRRGVRKSSGKGLRPRPTRSSVSWSPNVLPSAHLVTQPCHVQPRPMRIGARHSRCWRGPRRRRTACESMRRGAEGEGEPIYNVRGGIRVPWFVCGFALAAFPWARTPSMFMGTTMTLHHDGFFVVVRETPRAGPGAQWTHCRVYFGDSAGFTCL